MTFAGYARSGDGGGRRRLVESRRERVAGERDSRQTTAQGGQGHELTRGAGGRGQPKDEGSEEATVLPRPEGLYRARRAVDLRGPD